MSANNGYPQGGGYESDFTKAYGIPQAGSSAQQGGAYGRQQGGAYGQSPYGQPAYGQPGGTGRQNPYGSPGVGVMPPRRHRSTTGPKIMTFTGIALIVAAIVVAVLAIRSVIGFAESVDLTDISTNGTQITAEAGEEWALYYTGGSNTTTSCTVIAPSGDRVDLTTPGAQISVQGYELGARFTTDVAGTYMIGCNGPTLVGEDIGAGQIFGSVGGILFGVFGGLLGVGLTIAGGVWWASRRG